MIEDDLRAAFTRHETLTPPVGPVRAAIERTVVRRRRRRRRVGAAGAALALLGVIGIGAPRFVTDGEGRPATGTLLGEPGATAPTGAVNVLLVGVDGSTKQPARLADSVLLVHIPADRGRPYLVSLPRDLTVTIPGHGTDKLNGAFRHGAGDGRPDLARGYDLTRRVVTDLTGVRIDAGAVLTFSTLRTLTDALDGVEVCLPAEIRSWHTRRIFPAGCQRLDGAASVDLLRQRRDLPDGAQDRDRTAQRYASGLLRRFDERDVLRDPVQVSRLLSRVGPDLVTETGSGSLVDLLALVPQLKSVEPVGTILPTVDADDVHAEDVGASRRLDPAAAPAFLAALREDRLGGWLAAHPDRVTAQR